MKPASEPESQPEFTWQLVLRAYAMGVFPMGVSKSRDESLEDSDDGVEETIRWYSPDPRCIFDLETFEVSKRLQRTIRSQKFEVRFDTEFEAVMQACASRDETWITEDIFRVYTELFHLGFAHSVETFADGQLAGGLYGVSIGGAFMGESMFHFKTDASKVALAGLVERLKQRGFVLLDSQYMTSHLKTLGAIVISRAEYLRRLDTALRLDRRFR